jgi:superfamily II DNA or RNA helicase
VTARTKTVVDNGPLFAWVQTDPFGSAAEKKSGRSGKIPASGSQEIIPLSARATEKSPEPGSKSPEGPDLRDLFEKKSNDSAQDPDPDFHPLRGGDGPDFFGAPSESSAALSLRSQRTDSEGRDPGSRIAEISSGQTYRLQPPLHLPPRLRPYQLEAITKIEREFELGRRRTLAVIATGLGKTVLFAEWSRRRVARGRRVLVMAHRSELLEQAQNKLHDVGVDAAIEQANRRAGNARVVVASVQSLSPKRLEQFDPNEFDIVVDEAHHGNAPSYRRPLDYFANAQVLGVTATPDRGDGEALGDVWESVAFQYDIRDGIRDGWLVPITARQIVLAGVDLSTVRSRAGDLAEDELAQILSTESAILGQVDATLREVGDRRAIAFCVNVAHAKAIAEAINRYRPGAARVAHGALDRDERAEILAAFRRGEHQFLVNCELYTEGFDEPSIAAVVTIRPTKSRIVVVQQVGRGTRLLGASLPESVANGKPNLLWLDLTGNAGRHKLVGPLDALAPGEASKEQRQEAAKILAEEGWDLDEVYDEAERRLEEKRQAARLTVNARYFAHDIDPFFGAELGEPIYEAWAADPATPEERAILQYTIKLKKLPSAMTRGEAQRIIRAHEARKKLGLASYAQQKLLQNAGVNAKDMTIAAASRRIAVLVACNYDMARARPRLEAIEADELLGRTKR